MKSPKRNIVLIKIHSWLWWLHLSLIYDSYDHLRVWTNRGSKFKLCLCFQQTASLWANLSSPGTIWLIIFEPGFAGKPWEGCVKTLSVFSSKKGYFGPSLFVQTRVKKMFSFVLFLLSFVLSFCSLFCSL